MKMKFWAAVLALVAGFLPLAGQAAPDDVIVRYQMLFGGIHIADVEDRLVFGEDSTYQFESNATAIGMAALLGTGDVFRTSEGRLDQASQRLEMDRYFHRRKDAEQISEIDRAESLIRINYKGSASSEPFAAGGEITDPLTLNYLFYAFPERAEESAIEVLFTDGKRSRPYLYKRNPESQTITVPAGEFEAIAFKREEEDHSNEVWFIPELGMIPGRILIIAKAKIDFLLVSVAPIAKQPQEDPSGS
ncbi:MAG: DUF3108 domain-containing protein [Betaproteobacteria bacterium]|nr:DUF3108 domain-containing protein [Betaproteobacteria bacterium]